ncbi:hypothetical protein DICVIV_12115 [Dictyocaulus viviparus]|uniref:Uncharacterized protein n=1 Tax=Dictyocaulus viviparus TaxID=29172 RepID=A0A0D8XBB1_DICVI|nr:hypothetical protein DICVIV_12115 [Dictyocaulus viviparus]
MNVKYSHSCCILSGEMHLRQKDLDDRVVICTSLLVWTEVDLFLNRMKTGFPPTAVILSVALPFLAPTMTPT